jgi:predicted kinase
LLAISYDRRMTTPLIHLVGGSTGAGKTTYAIALSARLGAIRFSIDEWMTALFWMDSPQPIQFEWTIERVNRCEAQIFAVARQLAARAVPSVLDLGFATAAQRAKFATLAKESDLVAQLHFIDIPADERWRRVVSRNESKGETYRLDVPREMFEFMESMWEPPSDAEMIALAGLRIRT